MTSEYTLKALAEQLNASFRGDPSAKVSGAASLRSATPEKISFFLSDAYAEQLAETKAGVVILKETHADLSPTNCILSDHPERDFACILSLFEVIPAIPTGVHPTAVVDDSADIADTASIGPHCVIGSGVKIGENTAIHSGTVIGDNVEIGEGCLLYPKVTIYHGVILHNAVRIHSGAIIGSDGFGLVQDSGAWKRIPQIGGVVLSDDVEIGANTTIDRGALDDTFIGQGVKIDNQVQIAHNVHIGDHTVVAGCVGIAGSTVIGKHCLIGGGSCISGHLKIADGVILSGMTMGTKSIKRAGIYASGTGVMPASDWRKCAVRFQQLDSLAKMIKKVEKQNNESN